MHKLVAFMLGCVAGYMLNEYVERIVINIRSKNNLFVPVSQIDKSSDGVTKSRQ